MLSLLQPNKVPEAQLDTVAGSVITPELEDVALSGAPVAPANMKVSNRAVWTANFFLLASSQEVNIVSNFLTNRVAHIQGKKATSGRTMPAAVSGRGDFNGE